MTEAIKREDWFQPPEGILDGTNFEIAQGWIERERADQAHLAENPLVNNPEHVARAAAARVEMEKLLEEYGTRLSAGDEQLANLLTRRVEREVEELNSGARSTVTGEAHLLLERLAQVGHVWGVVIEGNPAG